MSWYLVVRGGHLEPRLDLSTDELQFEPLLSGHGNGRTKVEIENIGPDMYLVLRKIPLEATEQIFRLIGKIATSAYRLGLFEGQTHKARSR